MSAHQVRTAPVSVGSGAAPARPSGRAEVSTLAVDGRAFDSAAFAPICVVDELHLGGPPLFHLSDDLAVLTGIVIVFGNVGFERYSVRAGRDDSGKCRSRPLRIDRGRSRSRSFRRPCG